MSTVADSYRIIIDDFCLQLQAMYQQGFGPNGAPYGGGVNGGDYPMAGGYGPMQGRQQPMAGYRPGSYMQQGYTGPMGPGRPPMGYPNGGAPYGGQAGYVSSDILK